MVRLNVQLTKDEVEILLDLLGKEDTVESDDKTHLRRKLEETLQYINEHNPHHDVA